MRYGGRGCGVVGSRLPRRNVLKVAQSSGGVTEMTGWQSQLVMSKERELLHDYVTVVQR